VIKAKDEEFLEMDSKISLVKDMIER